MSSAEFSSQIHGFYGTQQNLPGQRTASGSVMGSGSGTLQSGTGGSYSGTSQSRSGTLSDDDLSDDDSRLGKY
jgi:hypothetical protein